MEGAVSLSRSEAVPPVGVPFGNVRKSWSPASRAELGEPQPIATTTASRALQCVHDPIKTLAANRRASHCSGVTGFGGRPRPAPDARGARALNAGHRAPTDCDGFDTQPRQLRAGNERGVQFIGPESTDEGSDSDAGAGGHGNRSVRTGALELPALPVASGYCASPGAALGGGSAAAGAGAAGGGGSGVTVAFLEMLRATNRPGTTLRDLFRSLILPATRATRCSYVSMLGGDLRSRPTHVLVCSWEERVEDVVDLVLDHAAALAQGMGPPPPPPPPPPLGCAPGGNGSTASSGSMVQLEQHQHQHPNPPQQQQPLLRGLSGSGWTGAVGGGSSGWGAAIRRRSAVYSTAELGADGGAGGGGGGGGWDQLGLMGLMGLAPPAGGGGGGGGALATFAVWLDLFAVNFHVPAAAPPSTVTGGPAGWGPATRPAPANKPSTTTTSLESVALERSRALPAAIAATRAVLLLPGARGAGLREAPCTLAAWHALRGRGCTGAGGGVSLALVAPPDVDMGLLQAAFENLTVSAKTTDEQGGGGGGGTLADRSDDDGAASPSRMSPDRIAVRAVREGANAVSSAAASAAIYATDPLPSRTVKEGLTAAAVAMGTALLTRPHGPGGGGGGGGGGGSAMGHLASASPQLPPTPGGASPPLLASYSQQTAVLQGRSSSVSALEAAAQAPPPRQLPPPLVLPSTSRQALLPSPLRSGGGGGGGGCSNSGGSGSPCGRPPLLIGEAWGPAAESPTGAAAVVHSSSRLLRVVSARSMSLMNPGVHENMPLARGASGADDDGAAAAATSGGGDGSVGNSGNGMRSITAAASGGGGILGSWVAPAAVSSDSGALEAASSTRRLRSLLPVLDAPAAAVAAAAAAAAAEGVGPGRQQQQLRRLPPAPRETPQGGWTGALASNGRTAKGPHGSSMLSGGLMSPPQGGGGGGGVWPTGCDDLLQPAGASGGPGTLVSLSGGADTGSHHSLPLPRLSPLLAAAAMAAATGPPTEPPSPPPAASAPLPLLPNAGQGYATAAAASASAAASAAAANAADHSDEASPFGRRRPGRIHGLPPRCEHPSRRSDDAVSVDGAAETEYDTDSDGDADRTIVLDSSASFLIHARSTPPAFPAAAPPQPQSPSLLPLPPLHAPAAPPPPLPRTLESPPYTTAVAAAAPPPAPPCRSLAPDLARLLAAAKLLAAMGQHSLPLRLARQALAASRVFHGGGVNNLDAARCAAALASIIHFIQQSQNGPQQQQHPQQQRMGALVERPPASRHHPESGSGACSPTCLSAAPSRLVLLSVVQDGSGGTPLSPSSNVAGGTYGAGGGSGGASPHQGPVSSPAVGAAPPTRARFGNVGGAAFADGGGGGGGGLLQSAASATTMSGGGVSGGGVSGGGVSGGGVSGGSGGVAHAAPLTSLSWPTAAAAATSLYDDAEGLLRSAIGVLERFLGPDHQEVVAARQGLAAVMAASGRHEEAIQVLHRCVSGRGPLQQQQQQQQRETRCPMGPAEAVLASAVDLAASLAAVGRSREARRLLKDHLRRLEEDEDDTAAVTAASIVTARNRFSSSAMFLLSSSAATAQPPPLLPAQAPQPPQLLPHAPTHGSDSPRVPDSGSVSGCGSPSCPSPNVTQQPQHHMHQSYHSYQQHQQPSPSGAVLPPRGLTALKRAELLGKSAQLLAQLKAAAGKNEAARRLYRRAIESYSTVYGSRHAITASVMTSLASLHHTLHEYGEALELYRAVLDIYLELYGAHHPCTTRISNRMGDVEEAMEEEEEEEGLKQGRPHIGADCQAYLRRT